MTQIEQQLRATRHYLKTLRLDAAQNAQKVQQIQDIDRVLEKHAADEWPDFAGGDFR